MGGGPSNRGLRTHRGLGGSGFIYFLFILVGWAVLSRDVPFESAPAHLCVCATGGAERTEAGGPGWGGCCPHPGGLNGTSGRTRSGLSGDTRSVRWGVQWMGCRYLSVAPRGALAEGTSHE